MFLPLSWGLEASGLILTASGSSSHFTSYLARWLQVKCLGPANTDCRAGKQGEGLGDHNTPFSSQCLSGWSPWQGCPHGCFVPEHSTEPTIWLSLQLPGSLAKLLSTCQPDEVAGRRSRTRHSGGAQQNRENGDTNSGPRFDLDSCKTNHLGVSLFLETPIGEKSQ